MPKGEYCNETWLVVLKTWTQTVRGMKVRSRKLHRALDTITSRRMIDGHDRCPMADGQKGIISIKLRSLKKASRTMHITTLSNYVQKHFPKKKQSKTKQTTAPPSELLSCKGSSDRWKNSIQIINSETYPHKGILFQLWKNIISFLLIFLMI